jgi:hypothetical protein
MPITVNGNLVKVIHERIGLFHALVRLGKPIDLIPVIGGFFRRRW